jgi:SEC-C motif-containing protein
MGARDFFILFAESVKLFDNRVLEMNCYCCSGQKFEACCEPFIRGAAKPRTAEELMRSRYSAYATAAVEYLLRSTHPSVRKAYRREEIEDWARNSRWQKLEIVSKTEGEATDKKGTVEFKAYYTDADGQLQIHHENSSFRKELGKWFFVEGKIL